MVHLVMIPVLVLLLGNGHCSYQSKLAPTLLGELNWSNVIVGHTDEEAPVSKGHLHVKNLRPMKAMPVTSKTTLPYATFGSGLHSMGLFGLIAGAGALVISTLMKFIPQQRTALHGQSITLLSVTEGTGGLTSKGIVITGGSKGLGFCMARQFLRLGDRVVICGRDENRLTKAASALTDDGEVHAIQCDVSNIEDVQKLIMFAKEKLGTVDIFVNNAGRASATRKSLWQLTPEDVEETCKVNTIGPMLCSQAAIQLFLQQLESLPEQPQQPIYHIFNFGFSTLGAQFSSSTVPHKSTKRGLAELTYFLAAELHKAKLDKAIGVHECSPGLVLTDLLLKPDTPVALRRFFNTIAEEPTVVAEFVVPLMRTMDKANSEVRYLQFTDAFVRVITGVPAILWGGKYFDKDGNRVGEGTFNEAGVRQLY